MVRDAFIALGGAFLVVVVGVAGGWLALDKFDLRRRRRAVTNERALVRRNRRRGVTTTAVDFVGRNAEMREFRKLLSSRTDEKSVLLVVGPTGIGKAALLRQFKRECDEREPPLCGPIVDLARSQALDELLESVVDELRDPLHENAFDRFDRALRDYRAKDSGRPTRMEGALGAGREAAAALKLPKGVGGGVADILGDKLVETATGDVNLDSLRRWFVHDVRKLAESSHQRLVLLLSGLDSAAADPGVAAIIDVVEAVAVPEVLLVVSAINGADASVEELRQRVSMYDEMRLDRFTHAEARRFAEEVIRLRNPAQIEQVIRGSERLPERLDSYRVLFEQRRDFRDLDELPAEAETWVQHASAHKLLAEIEDDFDRRLVLASSPLRWFNSALLDEVAKVLEPTAKGDEPPRRGRELLDFARRPHWIVELDHGWAIADESKRCALAAALRRRDPALFTRVHQAAADYHRAQIEADESQPGRRYEHAARVAAEAELLYHRLVLRGAEVFPDVVQAAAWALFEGADRAAKRLLNVGSEVELMPPERLLLGRLTRAADAVAEGRQGDVAAVLRDVLRSGVSGALTAAIIEHLLGRSYSDLAQVDQATERLRQAEARIAAVSPPDRETSYFRCWNAAWLAYSVAAEDAAEATEILENSLDRAAELSMPVVVGELHRVHALVLEQTGDVAGAEAKYRRALEAFQEGALAADVASVYVSRARLFASADDLDRATRNLDRAETIYRDLDDASGQATIAIERLDIAVARDDEDAVRRHRASAVQLGDDAATWNGIGNTFFARGRYDDAQAAYEEAIARAPNIVYLHTNVAEALAQQGRPAEAAEKYEQAIRLQWRARQRATAEDAADAEIADIARTVSEARPLILRLAQLKRAAGGASGAVLFTALKEVAVREARRSPPRARAYAELGRLLYNWGADDMTMDGRSAVAEAQRAFERALQLEEDWKYRLSVAECLRELGHTEFAAWALFSAAEKQPNRAVLRRRLVDVALTLDADTAVSILEACLEHFRDDADLHYALAVKLRERDQVRADFNYYDPESSVGAGEAERAEAELTQALTLWRETSDRSARRRDCYVLLARSLGARGSHEQAAERVTEARELWEDDEELQLLQWQSEQPEAWARAVEDPDPDVRPIVVEVSPTLVPWVEPSAAAALYDNWFPELRDAVGGGYGFTPPGVLVRANYDLPNACVRLLVRGVPGALVELGGTYLAGAAPEVCRDRAGVEGWEAVCPWDGARATWLADDAAAHAIAAGIPVWDPRGVIVGIVAAVLTHDAAAFVSVEDVAGRLRATGAEPLPEPNALIVAAEAFRALAAAGVRVDDDRTVVTELEQSERDVAAVVRKFAAERRAEPPTASRLMDAFVTTRWPAQTRHHAEVRLAEECVGRLEGESRALVDEILLHCRSALGLWGRFDCAFVGRSELATDEFEIALDDRVRIARRFAGSMVEWAREYPAAGSDGRSGVAPAKANVSPQAVQLARAVEEAAWDDPRLLVTAGDTESLAPTLAGRLGQADGTGIDGGRNVLAELVGRRVSVSRLWSNVARPGLDARSATLERLASDLRRYEVVVLLGSELHAELADPADPLEAVILPWLNATLFDELGVAFPKPALNRADELGPREYRIVIGDLARASGFIPAGSLLVAAAVDADGAEPAVDPETGIACGWISADAVASAPAAGVWDAGQFIARQLASCLREAAAEFTDLAWTRRLLARLAASSPVVVELARATYDDETICAVLRGLVAEGISVRDLGRVLESIAAVAATNGDARATTPLVEEVRLRLREQVWPRPLNGPAPEVATLTLAPETEAELARFVADASDPPAVYGFPSAARVLRSLHERVEEARHADAARDPVLVTSQTIRPYVRRLIAGQLPRLRVVSHDELADRAQLVPAVAEAVR